VISLPNLSNTALQVVLINSAVATRPQAAPVTSDNVSLCPTPINPASNHVFSVSPPQLAATAGPAQSRRPGGLAELAVFAGLSAPAARQPDPGRPVRIPQRSHRRRRADAV